jgi:hypothetical protein
MYDSAQRTPNWYVSPLDAPPAPLWTVFPLSLGLPAEINPLSGFGVKLIMV